MSVALNSQQIEGLNVEELLDAGKVVQDGPTDVAMPFYNRLMGTDAA